VSFKLDSTMAAPTGRTPSCTRAKSLIRVRTDACGYETPSESVAKATRKNHDNTLDRKGLLTDGLLGRKWEGRPNLQRVQGASENELTSESCNGNFGPEIRVLGVAHVSRGAG